MFFMEAIGPSPVAKDEVVVVERTAQVFFFRFLRFLPPPWYETCDADGPMSGIVHVRTIVN